MYLVAEGGPCSDVGNLADPVADVEDRLLGVPESLVKLWHTSISQYRQSEKENYPPSDLQSLNKRTTSASLLVTVNGAGAFSHATIFIATYVDGFVLPDDTTEPVVSDALPDVEDLSKKNGTFNPITHITPPRIPPIPSTEERTITVRPQRMNAPPAIWTGFKSFVEYEPELQLPQPSLYDDKVRAIHFPSTSRLYPTFMAILQVVYNVETASGTTESKGQLVEEGDLASVVQAAEDEIDEREIGELAEMLV
ncbi:hypothetical protein BDZ89DRAFT_1158413 [Hymenopellis radicata]|nr:hypothetical protein BDZ89DRAFT_1158413 [Hymenopellis radicata]